MYVYLCIFDLPQRGSVSFDRWNIPAPWYFHLHVLLMKFDYEHRTFYFFRRLTHRVPSEASNLNLPSSLESTNLGQSFVVRWRCQSLAILFFIEINDFLTPRRPCNPKEAKRRCAVRTLMLESRLSFESLCNISCSLPRISCFILSKRASLSVVHTLRNSLRVLDVEIVFQRCTRSAPVKHQTSRHIGQRFIFVRRFYNSFPRIFFLRRVKQNHGGKIQHVFKIRVANCT